MVGILRLMYYQLQHSLYAGNGITNAQQGPLVLWLRMEMIPPRGLPHINSPEHGQGSHASAPGTDNAHVLACCLQEHSMHECGKASTGVPGSFEALILIKLLQTPYWKWMMYSG